MESNLNTMDNAGFFLFQHALVHSAETSNSGVYSMVDDIIQRVDEAQLRQSPGPGRNSVVWLLWHMARTEDVAVNIMLAGKPQVFDEEWQRKLNLSRADIGTGMRDEEVASFSERVDIPALLDYRAVVGRRTRELAPDLLAQDLSEPIDGAAMTRLLDEGAIGDHGRWLVRYWSGKPKMFVLAIPATGHNLMHLNEAMSVLRELRHKT